MLALEGGLCVQGPGNSNGNAAVNCTGLCLASALSYIMSNGNSNVGIILC
jgi:hypothetical protein